MKPLPLPHRPARLMAKLRTWLAGRRTANAMLSPAPAPSLFFRLNRLWGNRGTVALVIALSTPMLIAVTGLSIDAGYWYQAEESLQSAADAAALAAALESSTSTTLATSSSIANAVGDAATNSQFGFVAGTAGNGVSVTANTSGTTATYTATAKSSRDGFFSHAFGLGVVGVAAGYQYASATEELATATSPVCMLVTSDQATPSNVTGSTPSPTDADAIYEASSGGGSGGITANNCGIFANSTAPSASVAPGSTSDSTTCPTDSSGTTNSAIVVGNSFTLTGKTVGSVGCIDKIISNGTPTVCSGSCTLTQNGHAVADPYASMASPPPWPYGTAGAPFGANFPTPTGTYTVLPYEGPLHADPGPYGNFASGTQDVACTNGATSGGTYPTTCTDSAGNTVETCSTTTATSTTACTLEPSINLTTGKNYLYDDVTYGSGNGSLTAQSVTFNGLATGTTIITNGISEICCSLTFDGTTLYLMSGGNFSTTTTSTFPAATGFALNWSGAVAGPTLSVGSGTGGSYYFDGGVSIGNNDSAATATFYPGTYYFKSSGTSNNLGCTGGISTPPSTGAFFAGGPNITFKGGTYYFDGGLSVGNSNSTVTFGPGIYYIENGALCFGTDTIIADGATFVLEGNAFFTSLGATSVTMTAPGFAPPDGTGTSACVTPAAYATSNTSSYPYDGTNGEGICGVIIYQARNDTAEDYISEGTSTVFNGTIYAPDAELDLYGAGAMTTGTSGVFGVIVSDIVTVASGSMSLGGAAGSYEVPPSTSLTGGASVTTGSGTGTPLLVQ
jgi:Flp pilus assembly protein TadG